MPRGVAQSVSPRPQVLDRSSAGRRREILPNDSSVFFRENKDGC
jgi:hypothetical protein